MLFLVLCSWLQFSNETLFLFSVFENVAKKPGIRAHVRAQWRTHSLYFHGYKRVAVLSPVSSFASPIPILFLPVATTIGTASITLSPTIIVDGEPRGSGGFGGGVRSRSGWPLFNFCTLLLSSTSHSVPIIPTRDLRWILALNAHLLLAMTLTISKASNKKEKATANIRENKLSPLSRYPIAHATAPVLVRCVLLTILTLPARGCMFRHNCKHKTARTKTR